MAYFARQKRQTKTYWAELGFMALGLFGLQPGLFTNLLSAPHPSIAAIEDRFYAAYQNRPSTFSDYPNSPSLTLASNLYGASASSSWPQTQYLANTFSPAINTQQPNYLAAPYPQSANVSQFGASTYQPPYSQAAHVSPYSTPAYSTPGYSAPAYSLQYSNQPGYSQPYSTGQNTFQTAQHSYNQPYNQTGYGQPAYSGQQPYSQTANNLSNVYPQTQNFASQSTYPPYQQPAQSSYQQSQSIWPNAASYLAQANSTRSAPLSGSGQYGNSGGNYQSNSAYQSNNYSGARTTPYNAYEPLSGQQSLFGNGSLSTPYSSNSYYAGSNYGPTSAQSYPNQTANNGGLQRYRAPASPLYR